jgi:hypothetical protein
VAGGLIKEEEEEEEKQGSLSIFRSLTGWGLHRFV